LHHLICRSAYNEAPIFCRQLSFSFQNVSNPTCSGAILGRSETQECVHYDYKPSAAESRVNRSGVEPCAGEKDKRLHCFATWKNVTGTVEVFRQGCWLDDVNCYDR
jgi:hypothetical protein